MNDRISWKKFILEFLFFLVIMFISLYIIFRGQDWGNVISSIQKLSISSLFISILLAIFYVSAEGVMIYYLLNSLNGKSGIFRCITYSFIGFFYSGITPSATGGQPMQLYHMKKDGNKIADSTVVLMVVAIIYKFVLVLCGVALLLFWHEALSVYLKEYFVLYRIGISLNIIVVIILFSIMAAPALMKNLLLKIVKAAEKIGIIKNNLSIETHIIEFVDSYQNAVHFLQNNKKKILVVIAITFCQRISSFVLTYFIYRGFALAGTNASTIIFLQASIYIAVDMLPVPGAQGITEMMYKTVFMKVFPAAYLMPSLYVTRGINFYFLLIVSGIFVLINCGYRAGGNASVQKWHDN